jgi:SAM-dependent methyltransferase
MPELVVSQQDVEHLRLVRANVENLMRRAAAQYVRGPGLLLDIAPQDHAGARPFFPADIIIETLDIAPESGCTYTADICTHNEFLADGRYDFVVCTEVLEHTLQPFRAVEEIRRIMRPGGFIFVSVPFNFRIHGPLPDCWRFTEHGLRELFGRFQIKELLAIDTPDRPLMPIHYTVIAEKPN